MKKFTAVSMALVLSLGILTGCGGDNNASTPLSSDSQASGTEDAGTQSSEAQSSEAQASGTQDSGLNISEENAVDPHNWKQERFFPFTIIMMFICRRAVYPMFILTCSVTSSSCLLRRKEIR